MYLSKLGFSEDKFFINSLLCSKYVQINTNSIPFSTCIQIKFPIFDTLELNKSKLLILIVEFFEELTHCRPFLEDIKIYLNKGMYMQFKLNLTKLNYNLFLDRLNLFIFKTSSIKYSKKKIKLKQLKFNKLILILFNLDSLFDSNTKLNLPKNSRFWLEFEIIYNKNYKLFQNIEILNYSPLVISHFNVSKK